MKKQFSVKWKGSKKKRKQKKFVANAPLHIKHKLLSSHLSKSLRGKYNRRSFPVRKGDTIKIMRGRFKGKKGKISEVQLKNLRVSVEGIQITKKDGTKINFFLRPSNLQIEEMNLDDKKRLNALNRKEGVKAEKQEEKEQKNVEEGKTNKKEKSKEGEVKKKTKSKTKSNKSNKNASKKK